MKGILFNLTEEVVVGKLGDDVWDEVLARSGVEGAYTSLGSYPDAEFTALVGAASEVLELPPHDVVRFVGEAAIPLLAERFPAFFAGHTSARTFALTLNEIIHPEVRKLYPGADVPEFDFDDGPLGELVIGYRSHRRLCALADGFLRGSATFYGETVVVEHDSCMLDGAPVCSLRCRFTPTAP